MHECDHHSIRHPKKFPGVRFLSLLLTLVALRLLGELGKVDRVFTRFGHLEKLFVKKGLETKRTETGVIRRTSLEEEKIIFQKESRG